MGLKKKGLERMKILMKNGLTNRLEKTIQDYCKNWWENLGRGREWYGLVEGLILGKLGEILRVMILEKIFSFGGFGLLSF